MCKHSVRCPVSRVLTTAALVMWGIKNDRDLKLDCGTIWHRGGECGSGSSLLLLLLLLLLLALLLLLIFVKLLCRPGEAARVR